MNYNPKVFIYRKSIRPDTMSKVNGAKVAIETCLNVKKGERVLILTDVSKAAIAESLFQAAQDVGANAILMKIPDVAKDGQEPPAPVGKLMKDMDVIVITTEMSMSHTGARRRASKAGTRIATMPGITEHMLNEGGMTADFKDILKTTRRVARKLRKGSKLVIKTELGTDLQMDIKGRSWVTEDTGICHKKGDFTNLPAGEMFIAPLEGSANGVIMVDGSFNDPLLNPVKVNVKDGYATRIVGAHDVVKELNKGGKTGRNIGKIGIGLNPEAKIIGKILEDTKVLGTVNIGFGDNYMFGGRVKSSVHIVGLIKNPTVVIDNVIIMKEGELKI